MSEYWISPPHFGPLGAKNTTVVHTPRNIDLPAHVVLSPDLGSDPGGVLQKQQKKKKYVCLSFWLMGLALLTTGAIIVALFLVPETELANGNSDNDSSSYLSRTNCLDLLPLEDKVKNSEVVCVGSMMPDMSLKVEQVIKGDLDLSHLQISPAGKSCFEATSSPQVFFLSPERQSRSVKQSSSSHYWMPKYRALVASEKAVDIIKHLASENQALDNIQVSTEGKTTIYFLGSPLIINSGLICGGRGLIRVVFVAPLSVGHWELLGVNYEA